MEYLIHLLSERVINKKKKEEKAKRKDEAEDLSGQPASYNFSIPSTLIFKYE